MGHGVGGVEAAAAMWCDRRGGGGDAVWRSCTSSTPPLHLVTHLHPYTQPTPHSHPCIRQALGGPSYLAQHVPLSPIPMPDVKQPPACEELCKQVREKGGQRRHVQRPGMCRAQACAGPIPLRVINGTGFVAVWGR